MRRLLVSIQKANKSFLFSPSSPQPHDVFVLRSCRHCKTCHYLLMMTFHRWHWHNCWGHPLSCMPQKRGQLLQSPIAASWLKSLPTIIFGSKLRGPNIGSPARNLLPSIFHHWPPSWHVAVWYHEEWERIDCCATEVRSKNMSNTLYLSCTM